MNRSEGANLWSCGMPDDADVWSWVHRANIKRYRRIMATPLTATERQFLERRIREEEAALHSRTRPSRDAPGEREPVSARAD